MKEIINELIDSPKFLQAVIELKQALLHKEDDDVALEEIGLYFFTKGYMARSEDKENKSDPLFELTGFRTPGILK